MKTEQIIDLSYKFRKQIERCKNTLGIPYKCFPRGCCGVTCYLLELYLRSKGCGTFNYVCGKRDDQSHAWLERDGIVVDITANQFEEDRRPRVYVGPKDNFYNQFSICDEHPLLGWENHHKDLYTTYKQVYNG